MRWSRPGGLLAALLIAVGAVGGLVSLTDVLGTTAGVVTVGLVAVLVAAGSLWGVSGGDAADTPYW